MKYKKITFVIAACIILTLLAGCKAKGNGTANGTADSVANNGTVETKSETAKSRTLSGRYIPDDEDSLIDYLEFKGSIVKTSTMGFDMSVSVPYEVKNKQVIISDSSGTIVLDIEDENNLIGDSWPIEGIRFTKE
jgi:hypothetical protein